MGFFFAAFVNQGMKLTNSKTVGLRSIIKNLSRVYFQSAYNSVKRLKSRISAALLKSDNSAHIGTALFSNFLLCEVEFSTGSLYNNS